MITYQSLLRRSLHQKNSVIPIFFAVDDNYVKYFMVCLKSLLAHAGSDVTYNVHVLHENVTQENQARVLEMETNNVTVSFCDVSDLVAKIRSQLSLRDYYSYTTYYRIFIPELFPEYDKVLYLDADTILLKDPALLFHYELGSNYVGAIQDRIVVDKEVFSDYVEKVLGISHVAYFNAGVLLMNCKAMRKNNLKKNFLSLLQAYTFVVAQDQDYLNILCQDKVLWLDSCWNVQMSEAEERPEEKLGIIHYNFAEKPWLNDSVRYAGYFWHYAKGTFYHPQLRLALAQRSEEDKARTDAMGDNLVSLALSETNREDNFMKRRLGVSEPRLTRQDILKKIEQYEREGRFDEDVEDDPPARELMPDEVDYLKRRLKSRVNAHHAFRIARWFMNTMLLRRQLIIKEIKGIENYRNLDSGAIITCNHINAMDSFAMQIVYERSRQRGRKLFRIIREGNYTSFPGFYGFLMRNCNTLPLSSNKDTMKKFVKAVDVILQKGHFILIYPEQSLWWNYKKPKPLKKGGFNLAAKNGVPVLPIFITLSDSNVPGEGGFPVQEYVIHVCAPIYPDPEKTVAANTREMRDQNYLLWKEIYEKTYGIPLHYTCEEDPIS